MTQDNIWTVLGIEPTDDIKTIKKVYIQRLNKLNSDEDKVAFEQLHQSYKQALVFAKQPSSDTDIVIDEYLNNDFESYLTVVDQLLKDKKNRNNPKHWAFLLQAKEVGDAAFRNQLGWRVLHKIIRCNRDYTGRKQFDNISNPVLGQLDDVFAWSAYFDELSARVNIKTKQKRDTFAQLQRWQSKKQNTSTLEVKTGGHVQSPIAEATSYHDDALTPNEWQRPAAFFIDVALITLFVFVGQFAWNTVTVDNPKIGLFPFKTAFFILGFFYFWMQDSYKGTTGKQLVGLEVVNIDCNPIGLVTGLLRTIAFVFTSLFDGHGTLSHTFVIKKQ